MNNTKSQIKSYRRAKNSIMMHTYGALLSTLLIFSSCKHEEYLPLSYITKTRQEEHLNEKLIYADKTLKMAQESFNSGIADGKYTQGEMNETLKLYNDANNAYTNIKQIGKNNPKYDVSLDRDSKRTIKSIEKTLDGIDFGRAELEKKLTKHGLEANVENLTSNRELGLAMISGVACFALLLYGINSGVNYSPEKKGDNSP